MRYNNESGGIYMTIDFSSITLFQDYSPEDLQYLDQLLEEKTYNKNELIIREGEINASLYLVLSGMIRTFKTVQNRELILSDMGPGESLGELTFIDPGPSSATCRTMTDTTLKELPPHIMEQIMTERPHIAVMLWKGLAIEIKNRLVKTNESLASFFDISQTLTENDQFRSVYGNCFR